MPISYGDSRTGSDANNRNIKYNADDYTRIDNQYVNEVLAQNYQHVQADFTSGSRTVDPASEMGGIADYGQPSGQVPFGYRHQSVDVVA
jgi:hypothetical protein